MNNSPVKSELYVALEMVELTQFLPFTKKEIPGILIWPGISIYVPKLENCT